MKFWSTGRLDIKIEFELFQPVLLGIRDQINDTLLDKNYGDEIESYDVIANIFEGGITERFKYSPKNKETDIDVNIDHDDFLHADFNKRCVLYLQAILHSIDGIKLNKHLKKFNFNGFYNDVAGLIGKYS